LAQSVDAHQWSALRGPDVVPEFLHAAKAQVMAIELKHAHILQALSSAEVGQKKEVRLRDTIVPGLCIRVRGRTATWHIMTRSQSIRVAGIEELSVKEARERARHILSDNKPPLKRAVAAMMEAGISVVDANLIARGIPIDPTDRWVDTWTWEHAMSKFLQEKQKRLRLRWYVQYKRLAEDDVFFPVQYQALSKLIYPKLDLIRIDVRKDYAPSRAKRVMEIAIEMLDWAWREHRTEVGWEKLGAPWWRELRVKPSKAKERYVPSIDDLVRTIFVIRNTAGLKKTHVDAVEFIVRSGQRIESVCLLERSQVEKNEDGSAIIHWNAVQMKGKQPHALWVPAEVVRLVAAGGKFAFPADNAGQRAIKPSVINRWLGNLWGKGSPPAKDAYEGKPGPRPGTGALPPVLKAAQIPFWTPHAVRTVLATELIEEMHEAAASAILAHKPPKIPSLPDRPQTIAHAEDVTIRSYSRAQRLPLKKIGMEFWHTQIEAAQVRVAHSFPTTLS
jgi:hypothetical protein